MRTLTEILADVREYAKDANEYRAGLEEKIRQADEDIAAAKADKERAFEANDETEYQAADERIRHAESVKEYSSRKLAAVKSTPAMDEETAARFRVETRAAINARIKEAETKIFRLVDEIRAVSDEFMKEDERLHAIESLICQMTRDSMAENNSLTIGLKSYINRIIKSPYENIRR